MNNSIKKQKKWALLGAVYALTSGQLMATEFAPSLDAEKLSDKQTTHAVQKEYVDCVTGREERLIELKVTPEERFYLPGYCDGHRNDPSSYEKTYCGDCKHEWRFVMKPKRVEITRDEWVGCEDLAYAVSMGYADVQNEHLMDRDETRILFGEPVTRDAWARERTYALTKEGAYIYSTKQY